jgi:Mg-chelatase subunit ChlD
LLGLLGLLPVIGTQIDSATAAPELHVLRAATTTRIGTTGPSSEQPQSPCVPKRDKFAAPKVLLLGETAHVTLTVGADCPGKESPVHVVLVLDASATMDEIPCPPTPSLLGACGTGTKGYEEKQAAMDLVRRLDLKENLWLRIGVVQYNDTARTLVDLTDDEGRVLSAIQKIGAEGKGAIDKGIDEGLRVLARGRRGYEHSELREAMVVFSDGQSVSDGCRAAIRSAARAKGEGVLMMSVCVGCPCNEQCIRQLAASPRYYVTARLISGLVKPILDLHADPVELTVKVLKVRDVLPDNMYYVGGSADPEPQFVSPERDVLEWEVNHVPTDGLTYTYRVEPADVGQHVTNVEAVGEFTDNRGGVGDFVFPVPSVLVLKADPPVTTTSVPPPPTFTPPPTSTPTPTATQRPRPIYIPVSVWHPCVPENYYSDVALVLDMSTSMDRLTRTGRTKRAATLETSKQFIEMMSLQPDRRGRHDQVAVVGFNRSAWIEQPLTNVSSQALSAIDRLPARRAEYTRLDLALEIGRQALESPARRVENTPVIVLLTDGLPNQVPYDPEDGTMDTTVLQTAMAAKLQGIRIYTIAIGAPADTSPALLKAVATNERLYYYEPDPEDLGRVYSEIVGTFGCPRSRLEWEGAWP